MTVRRLAILLAIVASLALSATAYADNSLTGGYAGQSGRTVVPSGQVQAEVVSKAPSKNRTVPVSQSAPTAAAQTQSSGRGTLPFTGLDVVWLLVAGVALTGVGLVTRRLASRSS